MVLRVTSGMMGALASSAPEPTTIVAEAPPFDPVVAVVVRPSTPGLFPGSTPEPLAEPDMADGVRKPGPPDAPNGLEAMTGKGLSKRT